MKDIIMKNKVITAIVVALLIIVIVISVGDGGADSETIKITSGEFLKQVSVSGKVVAERAVDLAFDQSGRVSAVYAEVGDQVFAGRILASVENGDEYANVLQKEANLEAAEARLESLIKGARPEEITIQKQEITGAESNLAQRIKSLSEAIKSSYAQGDDAIRRYADQLIANPKTSSASFKYGIDSNLKTEIEVWRFSLEEVLVFWNSQISGTFSASTIEKLALESIENLENIRAFLDKMSLAVNSIQGSSNLTQTTIDGFKSDIATARTNVNTAISSITSAETLFKSAISTLDSERESLILLEAGSTPEDIKAEEADVKAAQAALTSAQAQYRKTLITAPFTGTVTKMDVEVGGKASVASPQISMISEGNFIIESFIPEINISSIVVGNIAKVTLDAYGEEVIFKAHVINVDPAETVKDGVSTYKVELEFNENDPRIRSGMTANVLITTLSKENAISIPQGIIIKESGKNYVYKITGQGKVKQEVTLGEVSSVGSVEVLFGLSSGDEVIVTDDTK